MPKKAEKLWHYTDICRNYEKGKLHTHEVNS